MGSFRRFVFVALSCCVLAPAAAAGPYSNLLAPAGQCEAATPQASMVCLTNYARTQSGLQPLTANTVLDAAGDAKLAADISCGEFSHTPCGNPFQDVFATYLTGATGYRIGENIAWGTGSYGSTRSIMDGWLNSTGHRENILEPSFTEIGIGYLPNRSFQGYDGASLWSQEFGTRTPASTAAPAPQTKPAAAKPKPKPHKKKRRRVRR